MSEQFKLSDYQRYMQSFIRKIKSLFSKSEVVDASNQTLQILTRDDHHISRKQLSKASLDVLYGLKRGGYEGYLVGGAVRDLMLGIEPKDFDVVTNAEPDEVKKVFRNKCRLIGRRFRLAHVYFGREIIEVATFRGEGEGTSKRQADETGRLIRDNVYGTIEEDIWRRDFTLNSLYYRISDFSILDYAGGLQDIEKGLIRLIGDPETRYREDPVRMIRAVRFAAKLGFKIEENTEKPIFEFAPLLRDVSHARMFEEVLKLFHSGVAIQVFEKLRHYGLFAHLFPMTEESLSVEHDNFPSMLVIEALRSTDSRIRSNKSVNPAFLFAALLWEPMQKRREQFIEQGFTAQDAFFAAAHDVMEQQNARTNIPKRLMSTVRDIWNLQFRLTLTKPKQIQAVIEHPKFRAGYDFLGVRVAAGEVELKDLFDWWTEYQEMNPVERVAHVNKVERPAADRRPKNSRNRKNRNFYRKRNQRSKDDS